MIGQPIKVAGIQSNWSEEYAQKYSEKLREMDYYTRITEHPNGRLVVYSYRPFTSSEMEMLIASLFADN